MKRMQVCGKKPRRKREGGGGIWGGATAKGREWKDAQINSDDVSSLSLRTAAHCGAFWCLKWQHLKQFVIQQDHF